MLSRLGRSTAIAAALVLGTSAAVAQDAASAATVWRGRYVCNQGATGVDLVLTAGKAGRLHGYFLFYPTLDNPAVPRGCFKVEGMAGANGHMIARAGELVSQPADYQTVDLDGVIGADGVWSGRVDGPNCGAFELRRTRSAPPPC